MNDHLLSLTIWIPIVGALLVVVAPKSATKGISAVASFFAMIASILVTMKFLAGQANPQPGMKYPGFHVQELHEWIPAFNIQYFLGVDGISVTMVLLTGILSFICILASFGFEHWHTTKGIKGYFALFLMLEAGMMGVFESLDFFLFYVFWEVMLLPM